MSFVSDSYKLSADTIAKEFQRRGMEACYCSTKEEAKAKILSMIEEGASVTWGGSESMTEAGVFEGIREGNFELIDRKSASNPEEARALYGKIVCADYFLTSTNAFTKDGCLVNIDGIGNRVSCISHGPKNVIVLVSMNKMCSSIEEAVNRIRTLASPPNALRTKSNTPCSKTGVCADCVSPDCICCEILVTRFSRIPGRIKVVLCGEQLGF